MKESDVKKKFDAAVQAFSKRLQESYGDIYLAALRDAVKDLQESGINIALDVRLRKNGSPVARAETPIANATTEVEGYKLEWILVSIYNKSNLIAHDATGAVADFEAERKSWGGPWTPPATIGAVSLKDAIMNVIVDNLVQGKAAALYSVPSSGITGTLDKKPLAAPTLTKPAP